ncbi:isopentenyl-diphosphate Delta-isomerase [Nocardia cyriacigeorgica]|uniref:Isopentenyl-diphosphate Delta-isomerase n=2 Tax=Nocardia cyriacigeorgica TaxID=135487 RepID=H6R084_NOCCG|nr:isopentenyl-diphosphate Delta-isomerase [Nocardia cyriacigeorgica]BDU06086.1 isopentenyl-diphosphate Delta-isomerase [Nocardia cyriacigeorgica]CCF62947.1 Isopentenyl-diphosphate Delta-isomerase (IPP isomerase) (Isopentenyl pyrophosphate isomerase) (IPP:DMAPP isomerase) [Nocardia cyriacigeorgica GUH-2]
MADTLTQPLLDRETMEVELVDDAGRAVGSCQVAQAHRSPGLLHRAFSVLLFDRRGHVLLQQRAQIKTRFPGRWANTCCGHPAPGESVIDAANVRMLEEMGLRATLSEAGVFRYQAEDPDTGRVEHEWDHVLIGRLDDATPHPHPAEVADYAWVDPSELRTALAANPQRYSPWLSGVLEVATGAESR